MTATTGTTCTPAYPQPRCGHPLHPPAEHLRWQRSAPVTRVRLWDGTAVWLVTGYEEVRAALRSPHVSSDPSRPELPTLTPGRPAVLPGFFIQLDDPEHARLRRMLTREFMVKRIAAARPRIEQVVREQLYRFTVDGPPGDLVAGFARPLPATVFADLLGIPADLRECFRADAQTLITLDADAGQTARAGAALHELIAEVAARRATEPGDDLLSRLVRERERAGEIDRRTVVGLAMLLVAAGHDTASTMLAMSVLALLEHPEQLRRVRAQPDLIPGAVEELLRFLTPIHRGLPRLVLADLELGGQLVRAGEGIVLDLVSANHDERVFPGATDLDVGRDARAHVAFGYGVHQCLGQSLARALLQVALPTLLEQLPHLRLAVPAGEIRYRHEMSVFGVHSLPVTW